MRLQICFPKDWEAEYDDGRNEMSECDDRVDLCVWPGKNQGGILRDDDLDVYGYAMGQEDENYGKSRIVGAKKGHQGDVGCVPRIE